jgi:hypothetical protein
MNAGVRNQRPMTLFYKITMMGFFLRPAGGSTTTMMRALFTAAAFLLVLCRLASAAGSVKRDFMKAMHAVHSASQNNDDASDVLRQRLLALARPMSSNDLRFLDQSAQQEEGFDLTEYAFKYVGCQTIKTWSDELAQDQDTDSVFATVRFVVFRLCPADECSSYNKYGCSYNYGEYMLTMDDYLQAMSEYHLQRYQEYCATCIECMGEEDVAADDTSTGSASASGNNRQLDDTSASGSASNGNGDSSAAAQNDCVYAEACANYQDACTDYSKYIDQDASANNNNYEQYFECMQFDGGDYYLGPHCNDDGKTMSIGIYEDENCYSYVGDVMSLQDLTGMTFDEDALDFYTDTSCVSCSEQESYGLYQQGEEDAVYEMCEVLYDASAKCNRYMAEDDRYWVSFLESENVCVRLFCAMISLVKFCSIIVLPYLL